MRVSKRFFLVTIRSKTQVLSALLDESHPFNILKDIAERVVQRYTERGDVKWFHAVEARSSGRVVSVSTE